MRNREFLLDNVELSVTCIEKYLKDLQFVFSDILCFIPGPDGTITQLSLESHVYVPCCCMPSVYTEGHRTT